MDIIKLETSTIIDIIPLLKANNLPYIDITEEKECDFFGIYTAQKLVGAVGLEYYAKHALLRSLCVDTNFQSTGLGSQLVSFCETHCRSIGIKTLYLLTTTASTFFQNRGYRIIERDSVPEAVQKSSQFSTICPSSAVCLSKEL